jgi:hypothetical protein
MKSASNRQSSFIYSLLAPDSSLQEAFEVFSNSEKSAKQPFFVVHATLEVRGGGH